MMSQSMRWLGGSEEEVTTRRCLATLYGQWKDLGGSIYTLTPGAHGKIDVHTRRPSGAVRFTEGLISVRGGSMRWGRGASGRFSGSVDGSSLVWARGNSQFQWRKLQ